MLSKSIFVAFLSLALAVQALPNSSQNNRNNNQQCDSTKTVVHTVTITAKSTASTGSSLLANNGNNGNNNDNGNNNNNGKGSNNKNGKGSNNKNGKGSNNNNGKGSSNNNNGKGSTNNNGGSSNKGSGSANNGGKGNQNNGGSNSNPQTSLTLDPRVLATGFENNGQAVQEAGQVASLTSSNNFINFCLTVPNLPITNGKQITTGSCNPAPIGTIPSTDNMPSAKFAFPANFGTVKANTNFTVIMNIQNMETGFFVNAQQNYFAAPQQLNAQGQIKGHSHIVIEQLTSLTDATPSDPRKFAFFKGLNAAAVKGQLTATVTNGLAVGVYKMSSINTAANHQPAIVPIAQHGSLDDAIYFTVTADGKAAVGDGASGGKTTSTGNNNNKGGNNNNKGGNNNNKGGNGSGSSKNNNNNNKGNNKGKRAFLNRQA